MRKKRILPLWFDTLQACATVGLVIALYAAWRGHYFDAFVAAGVAIFGIAGWLILDGMVNREFKKQRSWTPHSDAAKIRMPD